MSGATAATARPVSTATGTHQASQDQPGRIARVIVPVRFTARSRVM